jgi:protein-S-isoprenylcysteine O-methyltransferase
MRHATLIFCLAEFLLNSVEYYFLGDFVSFTSKRYLITICFGLVESFYLSLPVTFQLVGFILMMLGVIIRFTAIYQLKDSFTHEIQSSSKCKRLYTNGLYSKVRHPAYLGFFLYAIGGQLILGNVICLCCIAVGLRKFFLARIRYEEFVLSLAFPGEYIRYKSLTFSGIA